MNIICYKWSQMKTTRYSIRFVTYYPWGNEINHPYHCIFNWIWKIWLWNWKLILYLLAYTSVQKWFPWWESYYISKKYYKKYIFFLIITTCSSDEHNDIIEKIKRVKFDFLLIKLYNTVHEVRRAFANSITVCACSLWGQSKSLMVSCSL